MRKVSRASIAIPVELSSKACTDHRDQIISNPSIVSAKDDFYRGKVVAADGTVSFTVRDALKRVYKNKCAYCEKLTHGPKTDHHRPKGHIVGTPRNDTGYYWLSYEWTNLLPSCTDCNAVGAKGSYYPLKRNRNLSHPIDGIPPVLNTIKFAYNHAYNKAEEPLLLHPEYCDPLIHFDFDRDGKIVGLTDEGLETVSRIRLDNEDLNGWRRAIYQKEFNHLEWLLSRYFSATIESQKTLIVDLISEWLLELVSLSSDDSLEYTLFRRIMINKFQYFFIDPLDPALQPKIIDIFLDYINSLP